MEGNKSGARIESDGQGGAAAVEVGREGLCGDGDDF